ncbi:MAG: YfhO family protein, partial [Gemmatales bacterium]|nr:YfhO family protein [Gemmatales bacterium]MDW8385618.1 YfhO family protein [Gemmatales bacterium]
DSLAVRYIVQPSDPEFAVPGEQPIASDSRYRAVFRDDHPIGSYNVMSWPRITELPPYTVYENLEAFPRAWLVGQAVPAPERSKMLETLKKTDLRKTVLIEGLKEAEGSPLEMAACKSVMREPNRLIYRTRTDKPAFLVFSEVWFPGWRCYVDGSEVQIYRANHAFRAVRVPEGEHEVVMVMDPASLRWGKWISLGTAILLASAGIVVGAVHWLRGRSAAS